MVGERIQTHAELVAENASKNPATPPNAPFVPFRPQTPGSGYVGRKEKTLLLQKQLAGSHFPPPPNPGSSWRKWELTGGHTLVTVIGTAVDDELPEPKVMVFYRAQDGNNYCVSLAHWHEVIILPRGRTRRFEKLVP